MVSPVASGLIVMNAVTRWGWGPPAERRRVVRLVVTRADDQFRVRVFGADGGAAVVLQEQFTPNEPRARSVQLADGTVWSLVATGCGCHTPGPLVRFKPPA